MFLFCRNPCKHLPYRWWRHKSRLPNTSCLDHTQIDGTERSPTAIQSPPNPRMNQKQLQQLHNLIRPPFSSPTRPPIHHSALSSLPTLFPTYLWSNRLCLLMTRSRSVFINAATWEHRTLQNWISYQIIVLDLQFVTSRESRPTKVREPHFKKQFIVTSHDFIHPVNRTVATLLTARENAASAYC